MEAGAIDVCNFDSSWSGGPTAWRRCAAVAHAYDVQMGHHEEPHVSTHLLAASRTARTPSASTPTATRCGGTWSQEPPEPTAARSILPDAPGLGWELDRDYIERHRVRG